MQARSAVVEQLIDEQLAVEKALAQGLDRSPEVMKDLEQSRRAILAGAYLRERMAAASTPSAGAIEAFYSANPALFAQRRRYHLAEIAVRSDQKGLDDYVRYFREPGGSIRGLGEMLRSVGIEPVVRNLVQVPEDMPPAILERLFEMQPGDKLYYRLGKVVRFIELKGTEPAPISRTAAHRQIEVYLLARARERIMRDEIASLRRAARIEYAPTAGVRRQASVEASAQPVRGLANGPAGSAQAGRM